MKQWRGPRMKFTAMQKAFTLIFFVMAGFSICLAKIFNMQNTAQLLLLASFVPAGLVAVFGSLRLRQEEEEKRAK